MKSCRGGSSTTLDRKTIEKNRRMHMKALCFKLASLVPPTHHHTSSKETLTQLDQLDHAAFYIQELKGRLDELKRRKQLAVMSINTSSSSSTDDFSSSSTTTTTSTVLNNNNNNLRLPVLEVRDFGDDSSLEVILISGLNKNFMFYEVITVLEEEGAEVVNATFSVVGDKVFHTIHSQVRCSRLGVETSRVCDRLKELVH